MAASETKNKIRKAKGRVYLRLQGRIPNARPLESDYRGRKKSKGLGLYDSEIDAAKAYDAAAKQFFSPEAFRNFNEENS